MSKLYERLFEENRKWVENKLGLDPNFFHKLAQGQQPLFFWIGCSDSRVPANEVLGTQPGEVFVHRNIANMVVHSDMSMLSVLDYAVNVLKIKHVLVCGHYGCGGVKAAMGNDSVGLIDNWIRHIKDVYRLHKSEIDGIQNETKKFDRFVELNIQEQVLGLAKTSIVQNAWYRDQELYLHGIVYGVGSGIIKDLGINISNNSELDDIYQLSF